MESVNRARRSASRNLHTPNLRRKLLEAHSLRCRDLDLCRDAAVFSREPGDLADSANSAQEQDVLSEMSSLHWDILREITEALHRLDAGTYGICGNCGRPIARARLRVLPFASLCRRCKQLWESVAVDGERRRAPGSYAEVATDKPVADREEDLRADDFRAQAKW